MQKTDKKEWVNQYKGVKMIQGKCICLRGKKIIDGELKQV